MKVCVSILPVDIPEALAGMKKAAQVGDLVELRIDRIGGEALETLLSLRECPVLVTNRKKDEGGFFTGSELQRIESLKRAVSLGVDMVDIELSAGPQVIAELGLQIEVRGGKTDLLISCHDFNGTPSERVLRNKLSECIRLGADIVKIVTSAKKIEDNLRVLSLIPFAGKKGCAAIAFCMGEAGRLSRVAAPLFGAPFTFASLERGAESAPGQLTAGDMKEIFKRIQQSGRIK